MAYFTTHGKFVHCARWDMNITLSGKYYFFDESKPYSARFCFCYMSCCTKLFDSYE